MAKFRKKPVVIEAIKWTGNNLKEILKFQGQSVTTPDYQTQDRFYDYEKSIKENGLIIKTLEGQHIATIDDWIIKGIQGEFYPCKPDIFKATYEKI